MQHPSYLLLLVSRAKLLLGMGILTAGLALGVSLFFPLKYAATAGVFVIPRQGFGVDPYTVIKSAERVGENLARVIKTSEFLYTMLQNEERIDRSVFPTIERKRRTFWKRMIDPQVVPGSGLLTITAFSPDPDQAEAIAKSAAETVMQNGTEYVGPQVSFKVADTPVSSRFPVKPNLIINVIVGFIFGVILAALRVLFGLKPREAA